MKKLLLSSLLGIASIFASSAQSQDLLGGQQLTTGQVLYSFDNAYYAIMQTDGNFVVYRTGGGATWSTNTAGSGAVRAVMQTDGNFVLYNANNGVVWASNTSGHPNSYFFVYNGAAVIYQIGAGWASNTSDHAAPPNSAPMIFREGQELVMGQNYVQADGKYTLRFQTDGNLVLYRNGVAIWASNTAGKGATKAVIQDRELRLYDSNGKFVWSPALWKNQFGQWDYGTTTLYFAYQADGNLVMYGYDKIFWGGPEGHDGPNCFGPPSACQGWAPPIIKIPL